MCLELSMGLEMDLRDRTDRVVLQLEYPTILEAMEDRMLLNSTIMTTV